MKEQNGPPFFSHWDLLVQNLQPFSLFRSVWNPLSYPDDTRLIVAAVNSFLPWSSCASFSTENSLGLFRMWGGKPGLHKPRNRRDWAQHPNWTQQISLSLLQSNPDTDMMGFSINTKMHFEPSQIPFSSPNQRQASSTISTRIHTECGSPQETATFYSGQKICMKQWLFFLKSSEERRVRKCPTTPNVTELIIIIAPSRAEGGAETTWRHWPEHSRSWRCWSPGVGSLWLSVCWWWWHLRAGSEPRASSGARSRLRSAGLSPNCKTWKQNSTRKQNTRELIRCHTDSARSACVDWARSCQTLFLKYQSDFLSCRDIVCKRFTWWRHWKQAESCGTFLEYFFSFPLFCERYFMVRT